jgi:hypothetical protein
MTELKTTKNDASVPSFLKSIENEKRRKDAEAVSELMERLTGSTPAMWGPSIVGFGNYHYRYASGREGDWFLAGFSPRKQSLTLYIMTGFSKHADLMKRLGKYKTGKSCLYINKLEDVDLSVLEELIIESINHLQKKKS